MSFQDAFQKLTKISEQLDKQDREDQKLLCQLEDKLSKKYRQREREYEKQSREVLKEAKQAAKVYNQQHRAPRELGKVYSRAVPADYFYPSTRMSSAYKLVWKVVGLSQQYRTKREAQQAAQALILAVRLHATNNKSRKSK